MKAFEIGKLEDTCGFELDSYCACVYCNYGEWFYDGLEGGDKRISKELAVMMIREMAEESEVKELEEFLAEIEK